MKNLVILIMMTFLGVSSINAQEIIRKKGHNITELQSGAYYKLDPEYLKEYLGTWLSEDEKFKIFITTRKRFLDGPDIHMEKLIGKYCIISSECQFEPRPLSLTVGTIDYKNGVTATFLFQDEKKSKLGTAKLKLIKGNRAEWSLENRREGLIIGEFDRSFSVPEEVIMTKVE